MENQNNGNGVNENTANENAEAQENNETEFDYPVTYTREQLATSEGQSDFGTDVANASDGLAQGRVYFGFDPAKDILEQVPEGFDVIIDRRKSGKFEVNPAAFIFAVPGFDLLMSTDEGKAYVMDAAFSGLYRRHAASAVAVNKAGGTFDPAMTVSGWLAGASAGNSSGVKRGQEKLWREIARALAAALSSLLKQAGAASINAVDLKRYLSDASFGEKSYPALESKGPDLLAKLEGLAHKFMTEKAEQLNAKAQDAGEKLPYPDQASIDAQKAIVTAWIKNRHKVVEKAPQDFDMSALDAL